MSQYSFTNSFASLAVKREPSGAALAALEHPGDGRLAVPYLVAAFKLVLPAPISRRPAFPPRF